MAACFEMICIILDLYLLEVFCQEDTVEGITEQKGAKQSRLGYLPLDLIGPYIRTLVVVVMMMIKRNDDENGAE